MPASVGREALGPVWSWEGGDAWGFTRRQGEAARRARCGYPLRVDRYPADHLTRLLCDLARVPAMGWPLPGRYPLATLCPLHRVPSAPLAGYRQAG